MSSSPLYITEVKSIEESMSTSNNKPIVKKSNRSKKMKDTVESLKKETKIIAQFKDNFLDYLIQEKTHFADLGKIEEHYTNVLHKNYNRFNMNKVILQKKQKEYIDITNQINDTIVGNYFFFNNDLLDQYDRAIEDLKKKIKLKEIEVESYKNIYTRAYKTNYLLFKRYEDETKYEKIHSEQYEKYKILKEHAVNSVSKQSEMLKSMKEFYEFSEMTYKTELSQKTKLFNQLDFEVLMIKKDTASIENALNKKIAQQNEIKGEISKVKMINQKTYSDYIWFFREYHKTNLKLMEVYRILQVKSLYDVIKEFNILRKENYLLHFRFEKVNLDISKINNQITQMNREIEEIKKQIEVKKNEDFKSTDDYMAEVITKTKTQRYFNSILEDSFKEKENLIKLTMNFLFNYITRIVTSLKNPVLLHNFKIQTNLELYQRFFQSDHKLIKSNTTQQYTNFEVLFHHFDHHFFVFVFKLFKDFTNDFYVLLSNCLNYVCLNDMMNKVEEHEMININVNQNKFKRKLKIQIVNFFSQPIVKLLSVQINQAIRRQLDKAMIFSRNEKEIFEEKKLKAIIDTKVISHSKYQNLITSGKELFKMYLEYYNNKKLKTFDENTKEYIIKHPKRSVSVMDRYTNDLVSDRMEKILKEKERKEKVMNKSALIKSEQEEIELNRLLKQKKQKRKTERDEEDYDLDDEEYANKQKIEMERLSEELKKQKIRKTYAMCSSNKELNTIYMRLNDLRNLELNYGGEKDKHIVNSSELNEIYYNFKKKFTHQGKNTVLNARKISQRGSLSRKSQSVNTSKRDDSIMPPLSNRSQRRSLWDNQSRASSKVPASCSSRDKSMNMGLKNNTTNDTDISSVKIRGSMTISSSKGIKNAFLKAGQNM